MRCQILKDGIPTIYHLTNPSFSNLYIPKKRRKFDSDEAVSSPIPGMKIHCKGGVFKNEIYKRNTANIKLSINPQV